MTKLLVSPVYVLHSGSELCPIRNAQGGLFLLVGTHTPWRGPHCRVEYYIHGMSAPIHAIISMDSFKFTRIYTMIILRNHYDGLIIQYRYV